MVLRKKGGNNGGQGLFVADLVDIEQISPIPKLPYAFCPLYGKTFPVEAQLPQKAHLLRHT